jgi:hypothetical protein
MNISDKLRVKYKYLKESPKSRDLLLEFSKRISYSIIKDFCLECNLITSHEINQIEFEVDNNIKN